MLHLYDLSASDDKNAEAKARREFEALHRLQINGWAPRILDSYQDVPSYAGEMYFFTVVDPAAPYLEDRVTDATWDGESRVVFARNAVRALRDLHAAGTADQPIVHRNLTLRTVLVKHDNTPIFTGFERSKILGGQRRIERLLCRAGAHIRARSPVTGSCRGRPAI